jgi:hypothetical protein
MTRRPLYSQIAIDGDDISAVALEIVSTHE